MWVASYMSIIIYVYIESSYMKGKGGKKKEEFHHNINLSSSVHLSHI